MATFLFPISSQAGAGLPVVSGGKRDANSDLRPKRLALTLVYIGEAGGQRGSSPYQMKKEGP